MYTCTCIQWSVIIYWVINLQQITIATKASGKEEKNTDTADTFILELARYDLVCGFVFLGGKI